MKRIGYIKGARIRGSVNLGPGASLNAPGGIIGLVSAGFGNIYYVDSVDGDDDNDGLSPQTPKLTIAAAYALCTDDNDDYIIVRGTFADSAITIAKKRLHLIGLNGYRGDQRLDVSRINSGDSATGATILIQAYDVEIANLQVFGNRDPGKHYPAIFADGKNGGTRSYIHDVFIPMMTHDATHYCHGIHLAGDRHTVQSVLIENSDVGILIDEEGGVTTYRIVLEDIKMRACTIGLHIFAVSEAASRYGVMAQDLHIDGHEAYTPNKAILVAAGGHNPSILRAHMCGYGANQDATVTKGNGKFNDCTWAATTGVSAALA